MNMRLFKKSKRWEKDNEYRQLLINNHPLFKVTNFVVDDNNYDSELADYLQSMTYGLMRGNFLHMVSWNIMDNIPGLLKLSLYHDEMKFMSIKYGTKFSLNIGEKAFSSDIFDNKMEIAALTESITMNKSEVLYSDDDIEILGEKYASITGTDLCYSFRWKVPDTWVKSLVSEIYRVGR
jgi:hypothetical protein